MPNAGTYDPVIDPDVYQQILDMDDDDDDEDFSRSVMREYIDRAGEMIGVEIPAALDQGDLHTVAMTCYSLKGCSSTIGAQRVRRVAETIQLLAYNLGLGEAETAGDPIPLSEEEVLEKIRTAHGELRRRLEEVESWFNNLYNNNDNNNQSTDNTPR